MGVFVNNRLTNVVAGTIAALIIALNAYLLIDTFIG
jgi:manganese transport protein